METSRAKILVVDDFELFRRFISTVLSIHPRLQIVDEASDGLVAVQKAEELQPDLILLDIGLPKLDGIKAALRIRTLAPNSKILFVSGQSSPDLVQAAVGTGASGYVVKTDAGSQLLAAVDSVLKGETFVSRSLADRGFSAFRDSQLLPEIGASTSSQVLNADLLSWLESNLDRELSVPELAQRAAMSPRTFARQFRRQTGTTPHQWLTHLRLLAAQRRLEQTNDSIDEIAQAVGWQTAATLRQHFSRELGTSPKAYRRRFSTTTLLRQTD